MSSLAQTLADPKALIAKLRTKAPALIELPRAVRGIQSQGEGRLDVESMAELQNRLGHEIGQGGVATLSKRDLRRAPEGYFAEPHPLGRVEHIRDALLDEVERREQRSAVYALITQYLEHFDTADVDVVGLSCWLNEVVKRWEWPWASRAVEFDLFDPAKAPKAIAGYVLRDERSPKDCLADLGVYDSLTAGGLGAAAFGEACQQVAKLKGHSSIPLQERLTTWALGHQGYQFDRQWPEFAAALLLPWSDQNPPDAHREFISDTLIAHAGDPRTSRRQVRWEAVRDRHQNAFDLFLAWLTRASVLQFLDVVGEVARDDHWKYRRAFWVSFLEGGHIGCAWVAFGANAAPLARRMQAQLGRQSADAPFGEITRGTGKGADWSALIMQIGDLVIADWSHSGKYNVWFRGSPNKPRFFQRSYYADELDAAPYRGSHHGSDRYSWQSKLAELIVDETGLKADRSAWRPRRT